MPTIYLISCSSEKNIGGAQLSTLTNLSFNETLFSCRKYLEGQYEQVYGPLNWDNCMPAIDRYRGRILYSSEVKASIRQNSQQVLIVSALFGLIKPNDLIPEYDLKMDQIIGNIRVNTFWRETHFECNKCVLNSVLLNINAATNAKFVHLLSKPYQDAFCGFQNRGTPAFNCLPNIIYPPNKKDINTKNKMGHYKREILINALNSKV